ncbi:MAG: hypothetical protein ABUS51_04225 [Acidobacteriota bacterium]
MAQRTIEEVFRTIAPSRQRGIPDPGTITAGVSGAHGDLATSLSQAATEIAQLRTGFQQQADLIVANTQAVQSNTSAQGSRSAPGTAGQAAASLLGGGLGLLSPLISGIARLFGGGTPAPVTLPVYTPPPPVSIGGILRSDSTGTPSSAGSAGAPSANTGTTYSPQITVNVNAMDSQSFMDRSGDIANAVREAMLNNHPINGVVADL